MLSGEAWLPVLLMIVLAVAAIGLLIGYRTRIMTAVCWFLLLSVSARNPFITDTGDAILILLLLWGMLLPLGAMWSIDSRAVGAPTRMSDTAGNRPRTHSLLTVATMGLVLQVCLIYVISVLYKSAAPWRVDFTAVWYALQIDSLTTPFGNVLAGAPMPLLKLLTIATLVLEGVGPVLVLITAWNGWIRTAAVFSFIGFHLGLASAMYLGIFPFVCIAVWTALLPSSFWDRVGAISPARSMRRHASGLSAIFDRWLPRATRPPRLQPRLATSLAALTLMVSSGLLAYHNMAPHTLADVLGPTWGKTTNAIRSVGVYQHWTMFAPRPGTLDSWYSATGVGVDGSRRNVLFEGNWPAFESPDPYAKPALVRSAFPDGKWEKYLFKYYWTDEFEPVRHLLPAYLWNRWHRLHPDEPLERIDIERFVEETQPPGETAEIEREVLVSYSGPISPGDMSPLSAE